MCSVVPLESATVPAPVQFPSKPANGPAACAWLVETDIMSAAPTPAAVRACPKKPKPKRFIVSFPIKIDVSRKDTSRRIEDLVSPQYVRFKCQMPLAPSRDGRRHLHSAESRHPANARPAASSYAPARFATT